MAQEIMGPSEAQWKLGRLAAKAEQDGYGPAEVAEGRECAAAIEVWRRRGEIALACAARFGEESLARFAVDVGVSAAGLEEAIEIARRAAAS